jgi:hypothetical protein
MFTRGLPSVRMIPWRVASASLMFFQWEKDACTIDKSDGRGHNMSSRVYEGHDGFIYGEYSQRMITRRREQDAYTQQ